MSNVGQAQLVLCITHWGAFSLIPPQVLHVVQSAVHPNRLNFCINTQARTSIVLALRGIVGFKGYRALEAPPSAVHGTMDALDERDDNALASQQV